MRKLFLALLLIFLPLTPSYSHSVLVNANPSSGTVLADFPMEIVLDFNEELLVIGQDDPNSVEVFDAAGALVSGKSKVSGARISAGLSINGNGIYTVKYRAASKDGHVIEDIYDFEVQSPIAISAPIKEEVVSIPSSSPIPITSALVLALVIGLITLIKRRK
ncbi:MAG: copper resistance CopC family protein [Actinomycetota bacterium]